MEISDIAERPYEIAKVVEVKECDDYYEMGMDTHFWFMVDKKHGKAPKVGDTAKLWGGFGFRVRGLAINDKVLFYRTEQEQKKIDAEGIAQKQKEDMKKFEKDKASLDKRYSELPKDFRQRIDKFRKNNPDFRWKYESYEMFVCEEAVKIATTLKTPDKIREWTKMDYKKQKKLVNFSDEHSGNTFGMATRLAFLHLENPDNVVKHFGAAAIIVGSEEYGCVPDKFPKFVRRVFKK